MSFKLEAFCLCHFLIIAYLKNKNSNERAGKGKQGELEKKLGRAETREEKGKQRQFELLKEEK